MNARMSCQGRMERRGNVKQVYQNPNANMKSVPVVSCRRPWLVTRFIVCPTTLITGRGGGGGSGD